MANHGIIYNNSSILQRLIPFCNWYNVFITVRTKCFFSQRHFQLLVTFTYDCSVSKMLFWELKRLCQRNFSENISRAEKHRNQRITTWTITFWLCCEHFFSKLSREFFLVIIATMPRTMIISKTWQMTQKQVQGGVQLSLLISLTEGF